MNIKLRCWIVCTDNGVHYDSAFLEKYVPFLMPLIYFALHSKAGNIWRSPKEWRNSSTTRGFTPPRSSPSLWRLALVRWGTAQWPARRIACWPAPSQAPACPRPPAIWASAAPPLVGECPPPPCSPPSAQPRGHPAVETVKTGGLAQSPSLMASYAGSVCQAQWPGGQLRISGPSRGQPQWRR